MGCRIQIDAYKRQDDQMQVIIGFEGDNCETSILTINQDFKTSLLQTFTADKFASYNNTYKRLVEINKENGAMKVVVEVFATYKNELLNKLSSRIKVGDYYYDDTELRTLIHGLRTVKPYYREDAKNYYIRHLQHHGVNQEAGYVLPTAAEEPAPKEPKLKYTSWGTW